jgi:hypothetical protein
MEALIAYLGGFTAGIGTVMELLKKMTKLPEVWYKPLAILASVAGAAVAVTIHGWSWEHFIVGSVFLSCAQMGWDFLAVKPILKKVLGGSK